MTDQEIHPLLGGDAQLSDTETIVQSRVARPSMFKVLLINDDFTPMDFVVKLLCHVFHKQRTEATRIMLTIHKEGSGLCGVYPLDIAETKARQVSELARKGEHPLLCLVEEA